MSEPDSSLTEEQQKYNDELLDKLKKVCDELYPHFDTVHIFCTKHEGNGIGTTQMNWGVGNWYARLGQVQDWINRQPYEGNEDE